MIQNAHPQAAQSRLKMCKSNGKEMRFAARAPLLPQNEQRKKISRKKNAARTHDEREFIMAKYECQRDFCLPTLCFSCLNKWRMLVLLLCVFSTIQRINAYRRRRQRLARHCVCFPLGLICCWIFVEAKQLHSHAPCRLPYVRATAMYEVRPTTTDIEWNIEFICW